jgi:hypothetical protein
VFEREHGAVDDEAGEVDDSVVGCQDDGVGLGGDVDAAMAGRPGFDGSLEAGDDRVGSRHRPRPDAGSDGDRRRHDDEEAGGYRHRNSEGENAEAA